tara:strand:+ start:3650 stop:4135 length:486 start_codon:yes stop_codon:yes gene_type:complete
MSKFSEITFPFFGLNYVPEVEFRGREIFIYNKILDDVSLPQKTYLNRLIHLSSKDKVTFDFTANSLENIIFYKKAKWGIDNTGKIFNISKKQRFTLTSKKIEKIRNKLIWVKGISYPFNVPLELEDLINKKLFFVDLVHIDNLWRLYNFSYSYNSKKYAYI